MYYKFINMPINSSIWHDIVVVNATSLIEAKQIIKDNNIIFHLLEDKVDESENLEELLRYAESNNLEILFLNFG